MTDPLYINNPSKPVNIYTKHDLNEYTDSILSSCFKYYYGKVKLVNPQLKQNVGLQLSSSFLSVKDKEHLIIIDYPNVIYRLHDKYLDLDTIATHFYNFIYTQLISNKTSIFIVSKNVIIDNNNYDIENVFNIGQKLTNKMIPSSYFLNETLCIYNIDYNIHNSDKVSSNIDDLLGWFICVNLFTYLLNSGTDPVQNNKLSLLTNDKQNFNKNLFGLTESEKEHNIHIIRDISITTIRYDSKTNTYQRAFDPYHSDMAIYFLSNYVITTSDDIQDVECNITRLLETLIHSRMKKNNHVFTKTPFTRKRFPNMSYNHVNKKQKEIKKSRSKCKLSKMRDNKNQLKNYYYLYVFIKYVQTYLHKTENGNNDFFGNYSKEEMLKLIK